MTSNTGLTISQLIELFKEMIPALYREMGEQWCSDMINKLNELQKQASLLR